MLASRIGADDAKISTGAQALVRHAGWNSNHVAGVQIKDHALFATDLLHKIIRHSQAHHRRETIAFARRLESALERAFLLAVWRNFVKPRSERRLRDGTPATKVGLARTTWEWARVLSRRLFRFREELPEGWRPVYERRLKWPDTSRMKPLSLRNSA